MKILSKKSFFLTILTLCSYLGTSLDIQASKGNAPSSGSSDDEKDLSELLMKKTKPKKKSKKRRLVPSDSSDDEKKTSESLTEKAKQRKLSNDQKFEEPKLPTIHLFYCPHSECRVRKSLLEKPKYKKVFKSKAELNTHIAESHQSLPPHGIIDTDGRVKIENEEALEAEADAVANGIPLLITEDEVKSLPPLLPPQSNSSSSSSAAPSNEASVEVRVKEEPRDDKDDKEDASELPSSLIEQKELPANSNSQTPVFGDHPGDFKPVPLPANFHYPPFMPNQKDNGEDKDDSGDEWPEGSSSSSISSLAAAPRSALNAFERAMQDFNTKFCIAWVEIELLISKSNGQLDCKAFNEYLTLKKSLTTFINTQLGGNQFSTFPPDYKKIYLKYMSQHYFMLHLTHSYYDIKEYFEKMKQNPSNMSLINTYQTRKGEVLATSTYKFASESPVCLKINPRLQQCVNQLNNIIQKTDQLLGIPTTSFPLSRLSNPQSSSHNMSNGESSSSSSQYVAAMNSSSSSMSDGVSSSSSVASLAAAPRLNFNSFTIAMKDFDIKFSRAWQKIEPLLSKSNGRPDLKIFNEYLILDKSLVTVLKTQFGFNKISTFPPDYKKIYLDYMSQHYFMIYLIYDSYDIKKYFEEIKKNPSPINMISKYQRHKAHLLASHVYIFASQEPVCLKNPCLQRILHLLNQLIHDADDLLLKILSSKSSNSESSSSSSSSQYVSAMSSSPLSLSGPVLSLPSLSSIASSGSSMSSEGSSSSLRSKMPLPKTKEGISASQVHTLFEIFVNQKGLAPLAIDVDRNQSSKDQKQSQQSAAEGELEQMYADTEQGMFPAQETRQEVLEGFNDMLQQFCKPITLHAYKEILEAALKETVSQDQHKEACKQLFKLYLTPEEIKALHRQL